MIKNTLKSISLCLGFILMIGCSSYSVTGKMKVSVIPDGKYARIIKLDNPEGNPDRTLAGVVFATGDTTFCTDYPREETIKSLDDLTTMEKLAFPDFLKYAVRDGEKTVGYVAIPVGYRANIWRSDTELACQYKVQVISPQRKMGQPDQEGADKSITTW